VSEGSLLIVDGPLVARLLVGREGQVMAAVRQAYLAHGAGASSLPHSTFLRFPGDDVNRIIALPAYLGDGFEVAGVKWIASFPANVGRGEARASAVLILNDPATGRPQAILEGSLISAARTAASAALAARTLVAGEPEAAGLIGTGVINREIARYLRVALPGLRRFVVFDLDGRRAQRLAEELRAAGAEAETAASAAAVLAACPLVALATTAVRPHLADLSPSPPGATILHVSLRDLTPEVILGADNVVDDPDHVCRASTSVHLAEQQVGHRRFIRATLAQVLAGSEPPRSGAEAPVVFSPFGLGVLDLAVGKLVLDEARAQGLGTVLPSFLPPS
jgi:2,3-diaminopropionate biosynthesis protein SbnB